MSRVSICGHRETSQSFLSQMEPGWRLSVLPRSGWQQGWMQGHSPAKHTRNELPSKTHTLTYKLCPSVACRWKTSKEILQFEFEADWFRLRSSPSTNVFSPWLGTESLAEQFIIMLKVNFGVCAGAGHRPCPRNPISSLTDGSLGLYQPHTANKAKASAEQSEPRETQHSWHPQQWQKSSGGTFKIKPSVKVHTLSQHFLLCTVRGFFCLFPASQFILTKISVCGPTKKLLFSLHYLISWISYQSLSAPEVNLFLWNLGGGWHQHSLK